MRVLEGSPLTWAQMESTAVAVGVFDGVHRGHRAVIQQTKRKAAERDLEVVVATFDPHPLQVVAPERAPAMLTTVAQRVRLLDEAGVHAVAVMTFDDVAGMSPDEFAATLLVDRLGSRLVVVGSDFRFGRGRVGDVATLREAGARLGFDVHEVDLVDRDGVAVSSTRIREAIAEGRITDAAEDLGRAYELVGTVVAGDGRGRAIGIPTANLTVADAMVIPGRGVYAARVRIDGGDHVQRSGVVNVGVRPTFGGDGLVVEVHLLDFDADLYGRELAVTFVERIRSEQRFEGIDELVTQIRRDVATAREILR